VIPVLPTLIGCGLESRREPVSTLFHRASPSSPVPFMHRPLVSYPRRKNEVHHHPLRCCLKRHPRNMEIPKIKVASSKRRATWNRNRYELKRSHKTIITHTHQNPIFTRIKPSRTRPISLQHRHRRLGTQDRNSNEAMASEKHAVHETCTQNSKTPAQEKCIRYQKILQNKTKSKTKAKRRRGKIKSKDITQFTQKQTQKQTRIQTPTPQQSRTSNTTRVHYNTNTTQDSTARNPKYLSLLFPKRRGVECNF
jgi:hypothetical protein